MLTDRSQSLVSILLWQKAKIAIFSMLSVAVVVAEQLAEGWMLVLPPAPITVLGAAIGIYVSFRTNSAYDRWWEGRRLWGQLVNSCRHFTGETLAYLGGSDLESVRRSLVFRMIQYVHVLRCELRGEPRERDDDLRSVSDRLAIGLPTEGCTALLRMQLAELARLANEGKLEGRRLQSFDTTLATIADVQGGCERIRNTPFPPGYGFIAEILIRLYAVLLPLAIVNELHWWAIPVAIVVCLAFELVSDVGRALEEPFRSGSSALPLHALSRLIERNLCDALSVPAHPVPAPDAAGVLK